MSEDQRKERTDAAPGRGLALEGRLARATRLLDRIGRLARQARETTEDLVRRLLPGTLVEGVGRAEPESEPEREREPEAEAEAEHVAEHVGGAEEEEEEGEELPGRVVLVSRDPEWMFCYWDIAPAAREGARSPESRLTLRIHDVTDLDFDGANGWSQHLYPLTEEARWWHVPVPQIGRRYLAEVGYCAPVGTFTVLGRSESVATLSERMESPAEGEVEMATVRMDVPLADQGPHRTGDRNDHDPEPPPRERSGGSVSGHVSSHVSGHVHDDDPGHEVHGEVHGEPVLSHLGSSALWSRRR